MSNETQLPAANESKPAKEPRISKRIRQVVELLVTGECQTQKAAAARLGIHPQYVCRELKKPQVQVLIDRRSRETIATGKMRASARLVALLDAGSEHVSLDASKHVLGIAGIKPDANPQVNVNIEVRAGYVIDLSGRDPAPYSATLVDVSPSRSAPTETNTYSPGQGLQRALAAEPEPLPSAPVFRHPRND